MSVVACDIYKLVFRKQNALIVLKNLSLTQGFEMLEPDHPEYDLAEKYQKKTAKLRKAITQLENIINYYKDYEDKHYDINSEIVESAISDYENIKHIVEDFNEQLEMKKSQEIENNNSIRQEVENNDEYVYLDYNDVQLPEHIDESELLYSRIVFLNKDLYEELVDDLNKGNIQHKILKEQESDIFVILFSTQEDKANIDQFISMNSAVLSRVTNNMSKIKLNHSDDNTVDLQAQDEFILKLPKKLKFENVKILYDILKLELTAYENINFVGEFKGEKSNSQKNDLVEIIGWTDPDSFHELEALRDNLSEMAQIVHVSTFEKDDVRTKMKNNTLFKPFELVTQFMGVPGPKELDPSPFLAIFFVVFFGFALGDAGYGIIMTLAISLFLIYKKPVGNVKEGLKLLLYCSISTIIFGALTGGWFGINLENVGGTFGNTLRELKQIDLQSSIMLVLAMSLIAGFTQQLFGVFLEMVTYFKNKDVLGGILGPGTWLILLVSIVIFIANKAVGGINIVNQWINIYMILVLFVFSYGQGRNQKIIFLRPLIGIASLFNLTSFLSNTLSYARLLALGMATGVIASVVNLIAGIIGGTDSIVGIIVTSFILIIGHLFNIALNVMGTFVNIIRLQLVEFFPRFYQAKGQTLESHTFEPKYINIPPNHRDIGAIFINFTNLFLK